MNAREQACITEAFSNVEDQLTNIEAIKGPTYAKLVAFMVSSYSAAYCILKVVADAITEEDTLDTIAEILNTSGSHTAHAYANALSIGEVDYLEAVADGKRIVMNNNTHLERIDHE